MRCNFCANEAEHEWEYNDCTEHIPVCSSCVQQLIDGDGLSICGHCNIITEGICKNCPHRPTCIGCDRTFTKTPQSSDLRCTDCLRRTVDLAPYNYNVLSALRAERATMLFGTELEVAVSDGNFYKTAIDTLKERVRGKAILKHDGSIAQGGFLGAEIVSKPMTYENSVKYLENLIKNLPKEIISETANTCGFHVHVTKAAIAPSDLGRLLVMINDPESKTLIEGVAKRYETNWSKRRDIGDILNSDLLLRYYSGGAFDDKYSLLNITKHTIEFRIFKGSVDIQVLKSYMEFVKSSMEFAKTSIKPTAKNYIKWCKQNNYLEGVI